jgi:K+-sensing histidine kinase KdpD
MIRILCGLPRSCLAPVLSAAAIFLVTAILAHATLADPRHVIFVYVIPVAVIAVVSGSLAAFLASVASVACGAYCFYPPSFSFYVTNPLDVAELGFFLLFVSLGGQAIAQVLAGEPDN